LKLRENVSLQQNIGDDFNTYGGKNLLWSSKTNSFLPKILMDPVDFMGEDYFCNVLALHVGNVDDQCARKWKTRWTWQYKDPVNSQFMNILRWSLNANIKTMVTWWETPSSVRQSWKTDFTFITSWNIL